MTEAEKTMPEIFKAGAGNADARAMDEIYYFVLTLSKHGPVPEHKIVNFAKERLPMNSIERVVNIMVQAGMLQEHSLNARTGRKTYVATVPDIDTDGVLQ